MNQTVIGLSGHIDHGKTTLVQALTGINTDSLIEEQRRGMTIDIGFAFLNENITLIDVPGHEKFIKNMMAGVASIDLAILVIAADDGVMPQTREHFEILNLLNIPQGIIVINKTDLADEDWIEMVELEISEMVEGSFMKNSPIIKVSSIKNIGIDILKSKIIEYSKNTPQKYDRGIFRMHIDRSFTMKGYGTVVTGTVNSGSIKKGDNIEILPGNIIAKVRGLQSHGRDVASISLGDRAAINLQGIDKINIIRGSQISEPDYLQSILKVAVSIHLLSTEKKILLQNHRIRVHLGTQEVMARVAFTSNKRLIPGESAAAVLRLESPLVAARGDKFIIRSYSPVVTIGGGEVLDILIDNKWTIVRDKIEELYNKPKSQQITKLVEQSGSSPLTFKELKVRLSLSDDKIKSLIESNKKLVWKKYKQNIWLVTIEQLKELKEKTQNLLKYFHESNPNEIGLKKEKIRQQLQSNDSFVDCLLYDMELEKLILKSNDFWSHINFKLELDSKDDALQLDVLSILESEGFISSNLVELSNKSGYPKQKIMDILKVSEKQGKILRIEGNLVFTYSNFLALKNKVKKHFKINSNMSISEFKEMAETTRKYAVPLLEYFDKIKITYRDGNTRREVK